MSGCQYAVEKKKSLKRKWAVAVIGMDRELEYLIKAWKRVCKSLQNAEAVGAVTVEDAKTSVQRLQEETLGARDCGISGSLDGREPTWN